MIVPGGILFLGLKNIDQSEGPPIISLAGEIEEESIVVGSAVTVIKSPLVSSSIDAPVVTLTAIGVVVVDEGGFTTL